MAVNIMVFVVGYEVRRRRVKKLFLIFVTLPSYTIRSTNSQKWTLFRSIEGLKISNQYVSFDLSFLRIKNQSKRKETRCSHFHRYKGVYWRSLSLGVEGKRMEEDEDR